jgi:hypothetical protein
MTIKHRATRNKIKNLLVSLGVFSGVLSSIFQLFNCHLVLV